MRKTIMCNVTPQCVQRMQGTMHAGTIEEGEMYYDEYDEYGGWGGIARIVALVASATIAIALVWFVLIRDDSGGPLASDGAAVGSLNDISTSVSSPADPLETNNTSRETTARRASTTDESTTTTVAASASDTTATTDTADRTDAASSGPDTTTAASTTTEPAAAAASTVTTTPETAPTSAPEAAPTTAAASYPTLPDGSPVPVVAIFDVEQITLSGTVPSAEASRSLEVLAIANSKFPEASVANFLTINPNVPPNVGVRVIELNSPRFPEGAARITPEHAAELDRVAAVMSALPQTNVLVIGHSDQRGGAESNYALSADRAASVVDYLVSQGIAPSRLSSRAVGELDLLTLNNDDAALALNRRTEFVFYGLLAN